MAETDIVWLSGQYAGLVNECKCRFRVKVTDYDLLIDKKKINAGIKEAERLNVRFLLTIWWGAQNGIGDDVAWARWIDRDEASKFKVVLWGRNDERDDNDIDPSYSIPTHTFTIAIPMLYERLRSPAST